MLHHRGAMALAAVLLLVATAALAGWAVRVPVRYSLDSLFLSRDAKHEEYRKFVERFGSDDNVLLAMYEAPDVFAPAALRAVHEAASRIERLEGVEQQMNLVELLHFLDQLRRGALLAGAFTRELRDLPGLVARAPALRPHLVRTGSCFRGTFVSPAGDATLLYVQISVAARADSARRRRLLDGMRAIFAEVAARHGGRFALAGIPVIEAQYERQIFADQRTFLPAGVILFVVLLALYFRRVAGVLLPMISIAAAVAWTLGIVTLTGGSLNIVNGALPVLLLVIGITDAIHIMAHYYRRRRAGDEPRVARIETFREMRVACFITSFTTAVGFLSLMLVNVEILQRFGQYAALGLMLCYGLTIAGLWIGLVLAARPGAVAAADRPHPCEALLPREPLPTVWPWLGLAAGVALFALFGWLATGVKVESRWFQDFDPSAQIYRDAQRIEQKIGGVFALEMVLEAGSPGVWLEPARLDALLAASRAIERHAAVTSVLSLADLLAEASYWLHGKRQVPRDKKQIEALLALVRARGGEKVLQRLYASGALHVTARMRDISSGQFKPLAALIAADLKRHGIGGSVVYTGKSVLAGRAMDEVVQNMVTSLGFALLFIGLTMVVLFRSIKLGLLSMIPNVFPILATLGMMPLLGIDLNFSTMFVFSIALGIAVDDTIHVLARYQTEQRRPGTPGPIYRTYRSVGAVIVTTTVFLMLGVSVLYLSEFRFLHNFALLMQITLAAALFGDLLILPALLAVVDRPRPVVVARGIEGGAEPA